MILIQTSRFAPGQMVLHRKEGFTGLIFDVDPVFEPDGISETRDDQADRPWYHVLIDGQEDGAYVSEEDLIPCDFSDDFFHPWMQAFFKEGGAGDIVSRYSIN